MPEESNGKTSNNNKKNIPTEEQKKTLFIVDRLAGQGEFFARRVNSVVSVVYYTLIWYVRSESTSISLFGRLLLCVCYASDQNPDTLWFTDFMPCHSNESLLTKKILFRSMVGFFFIVRGGFFPPQSLPLFLTNTFISFARFLYFLALMFAYLLLV